MLTREQLQHFEDHGYLQVKRAVPDDLVHAALGAINVALCSQGGNVAVDGNDGSTQYCPGVGASDAILNLLRASKHLLTAKVTLHEMRTTSVFSDVNFAERRHSAQIVAT